MAQYKADMRDIRFVVFEQLEAERLAEHPQYADHSREMYEMVLEVAEKFATETLSPLNQVGDEVGCTLEDGAVTSPPGFKEAYKAFAADGWCSPHGDPEWGGMGLPMALAVSSAEMFMGACTSFMFTPGLTTAASRVIQLLGSEELVSTYVRKMNAGEWGGTMCLTEPQAGSAVGDTAATAVKQDDGGYLIAGNKIFISQGEHDLTENIIHLVLARTPGSPPGTKGLSLFVVPKLFVNGDGSLGERNDVKCTGIEEKMGIHASSTCSLAFGEEGCCRGWIIGGEGEGMRHMFQMMNDARIEVALQGVALGNASYQLALNYARERIQGVDIKELKNPEAQRVAIIRHPNVRRMLMECKSLAEGIRGLIYRTASYIDLERLATTDEERQRHKAFIEILTPICKAYCSEAGLRISDVAIQVLGGYGYIREYGAEQNLRDVRIAAIYEGTNSIQAIDLIARKIGRAGGRHFMTVVMEIDAFIKANTESTALVAELKKLAEAKDALVATTMSFAGNRARGDIEYPILQCKQYLEMFGDVLVAWTLLEQAVLAGSKLAELGAAEGASHPDLAFYEGKVATAKFFAHQMLPRALANAGRIASGDRSALDIDL